jgi:hypothetical protein
VGGAVNAWELLPLIRELFSRHPEYRYHAAWELQWLLYALNYTDELEDEAEIAVAVEVARSDWPEWKAA